jgi:Diadenosine tetraphosphate (Ap4A) hydrolase and other HIT family hydrolases
MDSPDSGDGFQVDPAFEVGSIRAADWPLCQIRLQDDARFPWLILIPRVAGAVEIEDLSEADRQTLMQEMLRAGRAVRQLGELLGRPVEKLNFAALGNVTPQLHVHVVGRRADDPLWPDPVWGRMGAYPWSTDVRAGLQAVVSGGESPPLR